MKFKINRSVFIEGLKIVQNAINTKSTLSVLQNVLLEANGKELRLTTTDLDLSISATCSCEVIEQGATTLPVKLLFNSMIKAAEGDIEIDVDAFDKAVIRAGSAKYSLLGIGEKEFPRLPQDEEAYGYVISQVTLKEMLRKVAYAASMDDTRRALKGVLMSFKENKLTLVASDGRRLALVENEIEFPPNEEREVVLPSKAVQELQRTLVGEEDLTVTVQKSQICIKTENFRLYSKLVDEVYPNFKQVIPQNLTEEVVVDRQLMIDALERASVIDDAQSTQLTFSPGKLLVKAASSQHGEAQDEVPVKYAGETIEIIYNPSYLMDALKSIDDDEVIIKLHDGHSAATIQCSIPFLYVIMPLRIS